MKGGIYCVKCGSDYRLSNCKDCGRQVVICLCDPPDVTCCQDRSDLLDDDIQTLEETSYDEYITKLEMQNKVLQASLSHAYEAMHRVFFETALCPLCRKHYHHDDSECPIARIEE